MGVKYRLIYLLLLSQLLNVGFLQSVSLANPTNVSDRRATNHQTKASFLERQGRAFYESGQLQKAISLFQQAISVYQNEGDIVGEAIVLSNLALVYQQLGSLSQAEQAISTSIELLEGDRNSAATQPILAQVLEIQGKLLFSKGQSQQALTAWERSSAIFSQLEDREGIVRSRINQAQALQSLGFYRKAIDTLEPIVESLKQQGESLTQVIALRNLGDALQVVGEVKRAGEILQQSLAIAERLKLEEEIAASQLSLANVLRALGESETAMTLYQQAADRSSQEIVQTQALLNQLSLSIENRQYSAAEAILPQIQINLNKLPVNRSAIYARINFAQSIMNLEREGKKIACTTTECQPAYILATAVREARILKNGRTEAYALGKLAAAYELAQQESSAEKLTQQALDLAQTNNASDIAYELHWQLGRLLKAQNRTKEAIAAYSEAVKTLQSIRSDLVAMNPAVQFSFRDRVEPIYRQLVELLLDAEGNTPSPQRLETVRQTLESLQLAELDNFLRQACLKANPILVDRIDRTAAVIYPIILPDKLAVVVSLPGQPLRYHSTPVSQQEVELTADRFRLALTQRNSPRVLPLAEKVYDWLIGPATADLEASKIDTLVFVLDGVLRNIPMSALHDGERYAIERYGIALTPGLQLLESKPLEPKRLGVLSAGLSESRQGFAALPYVKTELKEIGTKVSSRTLLDRDFTSGSFQKAIDDNPLPIVHLATHGQFSSELDQTFLLTWDDRIGIDRLRGLLQTAELDRSKAIELLVLSACETAAGDKWATLGLAGVATRSGARSTLATLWQVNDRSTAILMEKFYQELSQPGATKAEALRKAQISILKDPQYRRHPYYWAAYVLIGNWL